MRRTAITPRNNWQAEVEKYGMIYHHTGGEVYWNESAYYSITPAEVTAIEAATTAWREMALLAVQVIIDNDRFGELEIPPSAIPLIIESWNGDVPSIYGRFDLALVNGVPKLLEYNADTPTMLLEAAVIQWQWKEMCFPTADQFNSLHEQLIAKWTSLIPYITQPVYFAALESVEDLMTTTYLRDTAIQAGVTTEALRIEDIGWHPTRGFTDLQERSIKTIFKLYPWEWLLKDDFSTHLDPSVQWIEPPWKMLLSNKGILPILWQLFPNHPNLLAAYRRPDELKSGWVKKPLIGREGENIEIQAPGSRTTPGIHVTMPGGYGDAGFIYQAYAPLPVHDGCHVVIGSWEVDGTPAGVGIRESRGPVTVNASPFVPHIIRSET